MKKIDYDDLIFFQEKEIIKNEYNLDEDPKAEV